MLTRNEGSWRNFGSSQLLVTIARSTFAFSLRGYLGKTPMSETSFLWEHELPWGKCIMSKLLVLPGGEGPFFYSVNMEEYVNMRLGVK